MKKVRKFKVFIDFISLELKVPIICLVIRGISIRKDKR
jgi:hypothetical protein